MIRTLYFSFALSCLSIVTTVWINIFIARDYLRAHGKNRALFGLRELLTYGYQHWVAIIGIAALVLSVTSRHQTRFRLVCIIFSLAAITLVFARIWRLFVLI